MKKLTRKRKLKALNAKKQQGRKFLCILLCTAFLMTVALPVAMSFENASATETGIEETGIEGVGCENAGSADADETLTIVDTKGFDAHIDEYNISKDTLLTDTDNEYTTSGKTLYEETQTEDTQSGDDGGGF